MKISEAVSKRILELLKEKEMSQYRLYMDAGIAKTTLTNLIKARHNSVNLETLINIVRTLKISIPDFFDSPLFEEGNLDCD